MSGFHPEILGSPISSGKNSSIILDSTDSVKYITLFHMISIIFYPSVTPILGFRRFSIFSLATSTDPPKKARSQGEPRRCIGY